MDYTYRYFFIYFSAYNILCLTEDTYSFFKIHSLRGSHGSPWEGAIDDIFWVNWGLGGSKRKGMGGGNMSEQDGPVAGGMKEMFS